MICYSLAKSQSYDDGLIDIFTQYGDHLYTKNDYDGAIAQYILTIGKLEPSYVIRKVRHGGLYVCILFTCLILYNSFLTPRW